MQLEGHGRARLARPAQLDPGHTVEVDTPQRRVHHRARRATTASTSRASARRSSRGAAGRATMTPAGGQAVAHRARAKRSSCDAAAAPAVQSFVAPQLDGGTTGTTRAPTSSLDAVQRALRRARPSTAWTISISTATGAWCRRTARCGCRTASRPDWAPYSTGRWVWDPRFGWTWVDTAPWGWAPYHYGRWVFVDSYWAWAPGPVVVRPVYAPALVAFFGAPGVQVASARPFVSWVALGLGRAGRAVVGPAAASSAAVVGRLGRAARRQQRRHQSHDRGQRDQHQRVPQRRACTTRWWRCAAGRLRSRGPCARRAWTRRRASQMQPVHGRLNVKPDTSNFVIGNGPGAKPPAHTIDRPVVATRRPPRPERPERGNGKDKDKDGAPAVTPAVATPAPKIVPAPKPAATTPTPPSRPPFASSGPSGRGHRRHHASTRGARPGPTNRGRLPRGPRLHLRRPHRPRPASGLTVRRRRCRPRRVSSPNVVRRSRHSRRLR